MKRVLASALLFATLVVALFGLYMMLAMPHAHGCPLMQAHEVLCSSTVIEHIEIWNALLASFLILSFFFRESRLRVAADIQRMMKVRERPHLILRPTLLQELFAQGILNRKAP